MGSFAALLIFQNCSVLNSASNTDASHPTSATNSTDIQNTPNGPVIKSFATLEQVVFLGSQANFKWDVSDATEVSLTSVGDVTSSYQSTETVDINLSTPNPMVLTAKNPTGSSTATIQFVPLQVKKMSAMGFHGCAIASDDKLYCWGNNSNGQVGNDSVVNPTGAVLVNGISNVVDVGTGYNHTCALTKVGLVYCWGANEVGELGNNSANDSHVPTLVSNLAGVVSISVGVNFSCAVTSSGQVYCWGYSSQGLIDSKIDDMVFKPTLISGLDKVKQVALGRAHACALTSSGEVFCWGSNTFGALGINSSEVGYSATPVRLASLSSIFAISARSYHSCAQTTAGTVYCWGLNDVGAIGNNSTVDALAPVLVSGLSGVTSIDVGEIHACAITTGGKLYCWGSNSGHILGQQFNGNYSTVPVLLSTTSPVTSISANIVGTFIFHANGLSGCVGLYSNAIAKCLY